MEFTSSNGSPRAYKYQGTTASGATTSVHTVNARAKYARALCYGQANVSGNGFSEFRVGGVGYGGAILTSATVTTTPFLSGTNNTTSSGTGYFMGEVYLLPGETLQHSASSAVHNYRVTLVEFF